MDRSEMDEAIAKFLFQTSSQAFPPLLNEKIIMEIKISHISKFTEHKVDHLVFTQAIFI
jgi:hypothetical protein